MQKISPERFYSILYSFSIIIFLINFLIQGQITFSFTDYYGIIFKMDWLFWIGYASLLILIYFQFKNYDKLNEKLFYLTILLLVVYLIGTPFFYEHLARFEDTWSHSYLAQEIYATGNVRNGIDAYEEYPGSFLFYGILFQNIPYDVMKFFVPALYFLGMCIVYSLFKLLFNPKISFLSSVLYMFFNWTAEDNHISPQFLFLFISFVFLFIVIKSLKKGTNRKTLILTTLFSFAIVFSHPGTPIFLLSILVSIYLLCKDFRKFVLPLIIIHASIFIVYNFYTGSLIGYITAISNLLKLLSVGSSFSQVSQRLVANIFSRNVFIASRLIITFTSIVLGLAGIFLLHKRKYKVWAKFFFAWSFCMLVFSLFVGFVLKGEYYERFALISSLPLAGLAAYYLNGFKFTAIILILLILFSPLYFIAKYGNEYFESESVEKLHADCFDALYYTNCEERQKVVNSALDYDLDKLGKRTSGISREETIASMIYLHMNMTEVEYKIKQVEYNNTLDRIYSTYSSAVFR